MRSTRSHGSRLLPRASSVLLLALPMLFGACGADGPRARWTFEIDPQAPASLDLEPLRERVLERLPQSSRAHAQVRIDGRKLVVEGPLSIEAPGEEVESTLGTALEASSASLTLERNRPEANGSVLADADEGADTSGHFPLAHGVVEIDAELVGYARREGRELRELTRGAFGSTASAHAAGASVRLVATPRLERLLARGGALRFLVDAECRGRSEVVKLDEERARRDAWLASHPQDSIEDYDAVPHAQGGPPNGTRWLRQRPAGAQGRDGELVLLRQPEISFTEVDLETVAPSSDANGRLALAISIAKARGEEFGRFTEHLVGCGLAIVIDDEVLVLANVKSPLRGSFVIEGGVAGFSRAYVDDTVTLLRSGPLPVAVRFVSRGSIP